MAEQYHNVSVRLNDKDYNQLLFLHDKYNRMSYGKVSLADVLRISVTELFLKETTDDNRPVSEVKESRSQGEALITEKTATKEAEQESASTQDEEINNEEDIEKVLSIYEEELRQAKSSKGKPYSDKFIADSVAKKRKELEALLA
jgi:hypothetical protein